MSKVSPIVSQPQLTQPLGPVILCLGGGCPVYYRVFSSKPGFYPLDASSTPTPSCDNQKCLQLLPKVP